MTIARFPTIGLYTEKPGPEAYAFEALARSRQLRGKKSPWWNHKRRELERWRRVARMAGHAHETKCVLDHWDAGSPPVA